MAQSSGPVVTLDSEGSFIAGQREYRISRDGEVRISGEWTSTHRLKYVVGAGATGRSYIYAAGGYLFQSPVAYYSSIRQWDLSPGFEKTSVPLTRPIEPSCLNCHASGVRPTPGTQNGYLDPAFTDGGVSCERCHGPGDEHIARVKSGAKGAAIVNPARLDAARRDSVCAQCHLMGVSRIAKDGAEPYAPGKLLWGSTAVFVLAQDSRPLPANSHFEQLVKSACWRGSEARMWCGTCHDPHRATAPADRASWYRARCETCHGASAPKCAESMAVRRRNSDDCVSCHMPARQSATVQHAAQTDHTIQRVPKQTTSVANSVANAELMPFPGSTATDRELGLAYAEQALAANDRSFGMRAYSLLAAVYSRDANDIAVGDQLAQLLDKMGRQSEACAIFEHVTSLPGDIPTGALVNAGTCLANAGETRTAVELWKRALTRNPGAEAARLNLALALYRSGDATGAATTIESGLRLDPFWTKGRDLLAAFH